MVVLRESCRAVDFNGGPEALVEVLLIAIFASLHAFGVAEAAGGDDYFVRLQVLPRPKRCFEEGAGKLLVPPGEDPCADGGHSRERRGGGTTGGEDIARVRI